MLTFLLKIQRRWMPCGYARPIARGATWLSALTGCIFAFAVAAQAQQIDAPLADPVRIEPVLIDPVFIDPVFIDPVLIEPALIEPVSIDPALIDPSIDIPVERFRRSAYQGAEVLGGYLWDTGDRLGGLDQTFEEARVSFGIPVGVLFGGDPSLDNVLGLRPYFRADHFNGPTDIDLPGTVYDTGVTIFNQKKWNEVFSTTVILNPSVRSDFETSDNAFRLFGLALVNWSPNDRWTFSAGAVYFDRADFNFLPAFGFTYQPSPWWRIEATAPRPRIARRIWKNGAQAEGWAYLGGQLGGTTWAVQRASGLSDELTVRDFRVVAGYEVIAAGNRGLTIEAAYAFGRRIEYERDEFEEDLDDAISLMAGWRF